MLTTSKAREGAAEKKNKRVWEIWKHDIDEMEGAKKKAYDYEKNKGFN